MLILAIDTALDACSAALLDTEAGALLAQESLPMTRGHAEALMPLLARLQIAAGLDFAKLDRIVVTTGPGSFTGLRVGLAAARGIALAANKPCVGLTTLATFAAPLVAEEDATPILTAIDARHDQVFFQMIAGDGEGLIAAQAAPIADVLRHVGAFAVPRIVGNAADLVASRWPDGVPPPARVEQTPAPDIAWVAWLGAAADPAASPPRPSYLRPVDAKPLNTRPQAAVAAAS